MRRRAALVVLVVVGAAVSAGCNTARVIDERNDYRAELQALRGELATVRGERDALRAEVADLRSAVVGTVPRDCVATLSVPGEPRLDGRCITLDEMLMTQREQETMLIEMTAALNEAAARRGIAACGVAVGTSLVGILGPGWIDCAETVLAELGR